MDGHDAEVIVIPSIEGIEWERFNAKERAKVAAFLQYLRRTPYSKRTLAAIHRGLGLDWTSIYFCIAGGLALGWIERQEVGRATVVSITKDGLGAISALLSDRDFRSSLENNRRK